MASRVTIEGKLTEFGQLMDHLNLGRGLRERLYHRTAKRILGMDDELRKRAVASRVAALPPLALALDAPESGVPIEDFETRDGERPQHGTCVRVTCDGATLRFVLRCTEPLPQRLSVGNGPLSEIWQDDCVEIFLAPQGDGTYLHLVISAGGRAFVEQGRYTALTPFPCAVRVAADHWRAALDVPFAVLGAAPEAGARWSLNICRNRTPPPAEVSTWNEVGLTFHDAAAFGWLAFT